MIINAVPFFLKNYFVYNSCVNVILEHGNEYLLKQSIYTFHV